MKVQSNGLGQQSAALYLMSSLGIIERMDYSIFADPGAEKKATYRYLEWLKKWQKKNNGIPIIHDVSKNLKNDILGKQNSTGHRWASIPAFTEDGGMVRRQCTTEYKIRVVNENIRKLQGKRKKQCFDPVDIYFGISLEEMKRMNSPDRKNARNVYPFCGYIFDGKNYIKTEHPRMTRGEINRWMVDRGYEVPVSSSCVFCPFMRDSEWKTLEEEDFKTAKSVDNLIRDMGKHGMKNRMFLHRSLKPIDKVDFSKGQYEIGYDCYGYCNI